MKYKDGYLFGQEYLETLQPETLEDIILRISKDNYLSNDSKIELLKSYLEERKTRLDKAFPYTEENLQHLRDMNTLIERQSTEAIRTAWRVYQDELAEKAAHPGTYVDVEIVPMLKVPHRQFYDAPGFDFTEKEEEIWDVLCSPNNIQYHTFGIMASSLVTFYSSQPQPDLEAVVREAVYGCNGDEDPIPWEMCGLEREQIKDICFVWPFHTLFEHCNFAITDILRIQKFDLIIEMTDEIL